MKIYFAYKKSMRTKFATKAIATIIAAICMVMSSCQSNDAQPQEVVADSLAYIDSFEIECSIDTTEIKNGEDYGRLFDKFSKHRFVRYPRFKSSSPEEWTICNNIYGANLYVQTYGRSEELDSLIEYQLKRYIDQKGGMKEELRKEVTYGQMRKFITRFMPTEQDDINADEELLLPTIDSDFELYISCYFQNMLKDMSEDKHLKEALKTEHLAWKSFRQHQIRLVKALNDNNVPEIVTTNLTKAISINKTMADVDLYYALNNKDYVPDNRYETIPDQFIYDVYNKYLRDIKDTKKIGIGPKLGALLKEQKSWFSYMYSRKLLSNKLTKEQQAIFDNATNRLQKWHIVQLQNRFGGYDYCSDAYRQSLLSDSCTYTAMYKYVPMKIGTRF